MSLQKSSNWLYIGIVFVAAIIVILPIAFFGIPSGNDLPQHYQFAQTYYDSLINGDGFPNWSDKENFGYGGIGIRFYPPLAYYVLAFARIVVGNWFDASWLTFIFWMALGCFGVYFWTRCWFSAKESALAAVFYAVIPYHLNQLYTFSFLYADFAGAAVLPFCFAFLTRVIMHNKKIDILCLAVSYAVLVLTHLPSTIIGSLGLGFYLLTLLKKDAAVRQILKASIGICLGLAASSFYWLRMVSEMNWLNHAADKFSSGHFGFANGFFPGYLNAPEALKYNASLADITSVISFLFLTSAIVYLFYRKTKTAETDSAAQIFRTLLPLGLFAFIMTTSLSYPIWKILPPLQKIQFPWRWMSVVSMCGAIVAAASVHYLLKGNLLKKRIWSYPAVVLTLVLLLFDGFYIFHPGVFVPTVRDQFESDLRELPGKESFFCWWSIWSKQDALNIKEKVLAENREVAVTDWKPEEKSFVVSEGSPAKARIATFYYPRWKATVNDKPVDIEMDENGVMLIPLPAVKSTVKIFFQEPFTIRIASGFSIIVWLSIFFAFLFLFRSKLTYFKNSYSYRIESKISAH